MRNAVRALITGQICPLYSSGKVFSYIMEGLKSKNARQRTECLDTMGAMIEQNGVNVCQPTPSIALKEVARHISDRDNSVRSAALNCVVQAYFLTGEKVYKMIGNLSEKDLSMLDERIKRAKKTKKMPEPDVPSSSSARNLSGNSGDGSDDNEEDKSEPIPDEVEVPQTPPSVAVRYFCVAYFHVVFVSNNCYRQANRDTCHNHQTEGQRAVRARSQRHR